jgi:surface antigen
MSHHTITRIIAWTFAVIALTVAVAHAAPAVPQASAAPSAPSDLRVTAVSSSQLQVTWRDTSNNETGFRLWDGTNQVFKPANATSHTYTGLRAGQRSCVVVQSYRGTVQSSWTNWACATTPAPAAQWQQAYERYVGEVGKSCPRDNESEDPRGARGFICQCTSYAAFRLLRAGVSSVNVTGLGNAGDWHRKTDGRLRAGSTPYVGAVLEFGDGDGRYEDNEHVMFVDEVRGTSVLVTEYNWGVTGGFGSRWIDPTNDATARQMTWRYLYFSNLNSVAPAPTPNPVVVVTVDAPGSGFTRYDRVGAPAGWYSATGFGQGGSMIVARVNGGNWSRYGAWVPSLTAEGQYLVEVFIPRQYATSQRATYVIHHSRGVTQVVVNQNAYYDRWVSLGQYQFGIRGAMVWLADNTGEAPGSRWLGFDAVRWTRR